VVFNPISLAFHTTCPSASALFMARRPTNTLGSVSELQPLIAGRLLRPLPSAEAAARLVHSAFSETVVQAAMVNATPVQALWY
jgi:hypothetical protein